jgi:hypothetical protein
VFLPGHRVMVQIQSTLFPLYDRNPQTFVDNPLFPKPEDFRKATIALWRSADAASAVWLPVVPYVVVTPSAEEGPVVRAAVGENSLIGSALASMTVNQTPQIDILRVNATYK